ncbi:sialate O-acetylesterase [Arcticibacter eurypsychrophilus]|uniref:sialate O-acetylesterase n=1 Tax=Arcticibacter eurypsychrophilus TaxID=1434752 RepID=UPI00084D4233|nr:sialate O-acetylesterase [Arcticibacter eurypsychrophilus]
MRLKYIALAVLMTGFSQLKAEVVLPSVLGHSMILQREQPVPVWGTAAAGEMIRIQFAQQVKETQTDGNGKWKVLLDPMEASAQPQDLTIAGTNTIVLKNILIGEVWLCSGQSNMEYAMRKNSKLTKPYSGVNPVDELEYADNDQIRIFLVNRKELIKPQADHGGWNVASGSALRSFSAAGYFFAKELNKRLQVPVGMISSAIPGSRIEPWMPLAVAPTLDGEPGKFYTPMIEPLLPFAVKGFLWYQGETSVFLNDSSQYTAKMKLLIDSWRKAWNSPDLPFYYVQLAPFYYSKSGGEIKLNRESLPKMWEAQEQALSIPHTGMMVSTDLVSDLNGIHPGFKWEIGRRLALLALRDTYHVKVVANGPVYQGMKQVANKMQLSFKSVGAGLYSKDGQKLRCFTIAGADGKFVPADAVIKNNKVLVSASSVKKPVAVRFAWTEDSQSNFFNRDGLPAAPFRTDRPAFLKSNQDLYTIK